MIGCSSLVAESSPTPFGRYQLLERLAVGGMAELFVATAPGEHGFAKTVVIKRLLPHLNADPTYNAMFVDEAKLTARLVHPKIAQTFELAREGDMLFIAMEYVEGIDVLAMLRECAQQRRRIDPALAAWVCHEVLDALDYAHHLIDDTGRDLGIVHRDISPSNVLLSSRGDVKLVDFGIARAADPQRSHKTKSGTLKGKYGYMSPEQVVEQPLDHRSDLFSVGVVLAELLTGRRLFAAANELDVLLMVRDARLSRLDKYGADLDPGLQHLVRKALRKNPDERWSSAAEFRDAIEEWLFETRQRVTAKIVGEFVAEIKESVAQRRQEAAAVDAVESAMLDDAMAPALIVDRPPPRHSRASSQADGIPISLELGGDSMPVVSVSYEDQSRGHRAAPAEIELSAVDSAPVAMVPTSRHRRPEATELRHEPERLVTSSDIYPVANAPAAATRALRPVPATGDLRASQLPPPLPPPAAPPPLPPPLPPPVREPYASPASLAPRTYTPAPHAHAPIAPRTYTPAPHAHAPIAPRTYTPAPHAHAPIAPRTYTPPPSQAPQRPGAGTRTSLATAAAAADPAQSAELTAYPSIAAAMGAIVPMEPDPSSRDFDGKTVYPGRRAVEQQLPSPDEVARQRPPTPPALGDIQDNPDDSGDFSVISPLRVLFRLMLARSTGLLVVAIGGIKKEVYVRDGQPEYVSSNVASELFGSYLVTKGVLSDGELAMALAMMPHYGGRLGDTLVGLGLLKPLEVFRHLTRQVRTKLIDVCTWNKGTFAWYANRENAREAFPLDFNAFEILGAGAMALPDDVVDAWLARNSNSRLRSVKQRRLGPDRFEVKGLVELFDFLDGRRTVGDLVELQPDRGERLRVGRMLCLLEACDMAKP